MKLNQEQWVFRYCHFNFILASTLKKLLWAALTSLFFASQSSADSYLGYKTSIDGFGLWELYDLPGATQGSHLGYSLSLLEHPEVALYCNGKNKLYIFEHPNIEFTCKTEVLYTLENGANIEVNSPSEERLLAELRQNKKDSDHSNGAFYLVSLNNKDIKVSTSGFSTISRKALLSATSKISTPSKEELKSIHKLVIDEMNKTANYSDPNYKIILGYTNAQINSLSLREKGNYTLKISHNDLDVFIVPALYELSGLGGDMTSIVIARTGKTDKVVGTLEGCILSIGADVDSDEIPELIVENCDSSESEVVTYTSIFPSVSSFLTYEHN